MWNNTKKIIVVPDKATVRPQDLENQAREVFPELEQQAIHLQVWNTAFEEFIDIEPDEEILPMTKVKIIAAVTSILTLPITIPAAAIQTQQEQP